MEVSSRKYGDLKEFIKNPICKVVWAGWVSDTLTLEKAGWQFAMEQDVMRDAIHLIMKHEAYRMYGVSHSIEHNFFRMHDMAAYRGDVIFHIKYMASRVEVIHHADMGNYRAVSMKPMISTLDVSRKSIEDFNLFTPLTDTREILIEPKDVNECLERILKLQSPKQQELRQAKRRKMESEGCMYPLDPALNLHAQVLSIA